MSRAISGAVTQRASSSTQPNDARRGRQSNVRMVQNVSLIWLGSYIDEEDSDCQNTITHLRRAVNAVNIFTDGDECVQFLQDMDNEKVCMIISGFLGRQVISRVHDLSQIDSIFIFCGDKTNQERWAKKWPKIKGVFTDIRPICDALKGAVQQCEQNAVSISIMGASDLLPTKSLNQLDPSFMYTMIIKEILLTIHFEQQHIEEFIQHCRQALDGNPSELKYVDQLATTYRKKTPIWWYTLECFLYPMLNRALRTVDKHVDLMVKLGFFISDLHRQIQELHRYQFGSNGSNHKFIVYRGQGMEKKEFEKMVANKGGLISFNCFLSTSKTRQVSLGFAERALHNPQLVGVLFVMTIDPALPDTPFASVAGVGALGAEENEVLFSMNTVFRFGQIEQLGDNPRLFRVELSMTNEMHSDLRELIDWIREETLPEAEASFRIGLVYRKVGETGKAKQVFEGLLQQTTNESDKGSIYNELGVIAHDLGEYEEAIAYHEKSIKFGKKQSSCNHKHLASSYNNIGNVYFSMGDYPKALASHAEALTIRQQSLPPTHSDLATSYNNIGNVYSGMGDYQRALSSYEKALAIFQQSLPPTHPSLAMSYNNIGNVYSGMGDYPKALSSHEKALAIQKQSLLPTHRDMAHSYNNIGSVYDSMADYQKVILYYETALEIRQQSLPPTHPDLAMSYNNIGSVYDSMGDYSKALSFYEKALAIFQQSLPPTHPDLAMSYNNIGNVYSRMGDYPEALSSHEKALAIRGQSLPPTHLDLAYSYNNIGGVYESMGDYPKALSSHEKALAIFQQSCSPTQPDLSMSYCNIGVLHEKMNNYHEAGSCYECALDTAQRALPEDHPHVQLCRDNIVRIKNNLY